MNTTFRYREKVAVLNSDDDTVAKNCFDNGYPKWNQSFKSAEKIKILPLPKTVFHLESAGDGKPVPTVSCQKCGSLSFNVGNTLHCTAIRCYFCNWETVLHGC